MKSVKNRNQGDAHEPERAAEAPEGLDAYRTQGGGLVVGHRSSQGDEVGGVAGGAKDLRVQVAVLAGDGVCLLLGLILPVIGVADDAPLGLGSAGGGGGYGWGCGASSCPAG